MTILGVPNVGVLKLIDVHVELVIGVEVHVGNEEMCDEPSRPPPLECSWGCILFGTYKFAGPTHQLAVFLF